MQVRCPQIVRVADRVISLQMRAGALIANFVVFGVLVKIHELAEHWMGEHVGPVYYKIAALLGGVYACFLIFSVIMYPLGQLARRVAAWALWSELSFSYPIEFRRALESPGGIGARAERIDTMLQEQCNLNNSLVIARCLAKVYHHIRLVNLS